MKVLFVCPYPQGKAANQRFRFEQYLSHLEENGVKTTVASFWNDKQWPAIYGDSSIGYRIMSTVKAFVKRFFLLFSLPPYDTVFIHREATPIGPPWWEWCAAKAFRKRLIYDFDDAVWLPNSSKANARLVGQFKNHSKTGKIIGWSETVFAGNSFLAEYAEQFCEHVMIVPTTIDLELHSRESRVTSREAILSKDGAKTFEEVVSTPDKLQDVDKDIPLQGGMSSKTDKSGIYPVSLTIGWTGTHSTLKQLEPMFPMLERVCAQIPFRFLLIADVAPEVMPDFVEFRKWNKETEIADLLEIDIGIMPLYDTDWERGKCGFKALQYMALEIPAVVSGVGVNSEIVVENKTGFIAEAVGHTAYPIWETRLISLLEDAEMRNYMGKAGRERVQTFYSVQAFKDVYLENLKSKPAE